MRHVGVSNYSLARWEAAEEALGRPVLSNQVRYNLVDRRPEKDLLPWAQAHDRLDHRLQPAWPRACCRRATTPITGPAASCVPRRRRSIPRTCAGPRPLLDVLRQVAETHHATPSQIALAWLIRRPNVVVIPGASSAAQVEVNAAAADIELTDDEDAALGGRVRRLRAVGGDVGAARPDPGAAVRLPRSHGRRTGGSGSGIVVGVGRPTGVRYWTVDEAQAFLPRLRLLLGVIRRASHLAVSARAQRPRRPPGAPRRGRPRSGPRSSGRAAVAASGRRRRSPGLGAGGGVRRQGGAGRARRGGHRPARPRAGPDRLHGRCTTGARCCCAGSWARTSWRGGISPRTASPAVAPCRCPPSSDLCHPRPELTASVARSPSG